MAASSKQLALRARDLVARMVDALEGDRVASRFVDAYITQFNRPGLATNAVQRRDLLSAIRRESLLAMLARVQTRLPHHLTRRRPPVLKGAEVRAAEAFRQQCIAALGRTLLWLPRDVEEFRRDLDLYAQLGARQPATEGVSAGRQLRTVIAPTEGPFVDRTAFLLDPSLMERARGAAGQFLRELESLADQALAATFHARKQLGRRSEL